MKAGPKADVSHHPIPLDDAPPRGADRVVWFVERFLVAPKGTGARKPLRVRDWQRELVGGVFDEPRPRMALWSMGRGNGKTTLSAALGLAALYVDDEFGASTVVVARDERQARICFHAATRMVEMSETLTERTVLYQDKLYVPGSGSSFQVLPAEPRSLEGLDPSIAIVDEIGVVDTRTFEAMMGAVGKRTTSLTLCIGTPSPDGLDSTMWDLVEHGREHDDDNFRLVEYRAPDGCALDDETAWQAANPALDDLLSRDGVRATLPPKLREATFRRYRLGQWVDSLDEPWLPGGAWDACATSGNALPEVGADVVLALDGSYNMDATALVGATITDPPHLFVVGYWEPATAQSERALTLRPGDDRVVIADVEQAVRDAARRYRVHEVAADPYLWTRSLEVLAADGIRVVEYPQSMSRLAPACSGLYQGVLERQVTHDGNRDLSRHVAHVVLRTDSRGSRIVKDQKHSARRVDLAVAAVMAHSRAVDLANRPKPSIYVG